MTPAADRYLVEYVAVAVQTDPPALVMTVATYPVPVVTHLGPGAFVVLFFGAPLECHAVASAPGALLLVETHDAPEAAPAGCTACVIRTWSQDGSQPIDPTFLVVAGLAATSETHRLATDAEIAQVAAPRTAAIEGVSA